MNIPQGMVGGDLPRPSKEPKVIVIVGSSGVGKTTAVDPLRDRNNSIIYDSEGTDYPRNGRGVVVPRRYITRAPRNAQSTLENMNTTKAEFEKFLLSGDVFFPWKRDLGGESPEYYGFESLESIDKDIFQGWRYLKQLDKDWASTPYYSGNSQSVIVLSGNNALGKKVKNIILDGRDDTVIVGISLSSNERERRLQARNPEMFKLDPKQMEIRLADPPDRVEQHSHFVIDNAATLEDLQRTLAKYVGGVLARRIDQANKLDNKRGRWHTYFYPPNIGFS